TGMPGTVGSLLVPDHSYPTIDKEVDPALLALYAMLRAVLRLVVPASGLKRSTEVELLVLRHELKASVRPSPVVVGGVDPKHPFQMAVAEHDHPVQAL